MKTKNKIYTAVLLVLLIAGVCSAVSAVETLEPWEEAFLEEYGDQWLYEDYGRYWFEYFLYEGNDEERYNELLLLYQEHEARAAAGLPYLEPSTPEDNTLEPWEEVFLEEYGDWWLYEDYGRYWFEYFLYEGNEEERYNELLALYEELAAQNAVPSETLVVPETPVQNITNASVQNVTNVTVENMTVFPTQNVTNLTVENVTETPIQNITNVTVGNNTETPMQNVTAPVGQDPESGIPVVPIVIGGIVVILLVIGGVILVKRKSRTSEDGTTDPLYAPSATTDEVSADIQPSVLPDSPAVIVPEVKVAVSLATPKECYSAVSAFLAEKYGIMHVSSLTPRQLLEFGEPTAELKEFILLYEQIRYAPGSSDDDSVKLSELARDILKH